MCLLSWEGKEAAMEWTCSSSSTWPIAVVEAVLGGSARKERKGGCLAVEEEVVVCSSLKIISHQLFQWVVVEGLGEGVGEAGGEEEEGGRTRTRCGIWSLRRIIGLGSGNVASRIGLVVRTALLCIISYGP
jgi:hypothetical protein